jgi:hypothetical protein
VLASEHTSKDQRYRRVELEHVTRLWFGLELGDKAGLTETRCPVFDLSVEPTLLRPSCSSLSRGQDATDRQGLQKNRAACWIRPQAERASAHPKTKRYLPEYSIGNIGP